MYADGYGQFDLGRSGWLAQPAAARAVRCSDCAECTVQCPNGVDIRGNLIRAQELFA
jgi:predicted aldo/keto reductase-like oxidoreductase